MNAVNKQKKVDRLHKVYYNGIVQNVGTSTAKLVKAK